MIAASLIVVLVLDKCGATASITFSAVPLSTKTHGYSLNILQRHLSANILAGSPAVFSRR